MGSCSNTYEWCAPGISAEIQNLQNVPAEALQWWMESLSRFQGITIASVASLPPEARTEKEILEAQGIQSLIVMPMIWGGRLEGFVGFDSVRTERKWTAENADPLKLLASMIINALKRKEAEDSLRQAREELQKSEERLKYALEGSEEGVWDWNMETNEVYFSLQWKQMLGFEEHEVSSALHEWEDRVHPEDLPGAYAYIQGHLYGETHVYAHEYRMRCKDGSWKWILDRGKVYAWARDGKPLRMSGTHVDITRRKEAETALHQALALKSRVTAIASHELRSPLVSLKASTVMLLERLSGGIDDGSHALIKAMGETIDRLLRVTTEILDLAKYEAGKMSFEFQRNDLNEVVRESFSAMAPVAEELAVNFTLRLDPTAKPVLSDRDKITQVVDNLLNNALKFTAKREGGSVVLSTIQEHEHFRVEVKDTGPGMKPDEISQLFVPFAQVGDDADLKQKGTGLGLAISKEIIEGHHGRIWAESEQGKGSVFCFELPLAQ